MVRATVVTVLAATALAAVHGPAIAGSDETALFRDWVRARCLAVAAGDGALGRDAAATAWAYVERGGLPGEAYAAGERLVSAALARPAPGSATARFDVMKCLDLAASREVGRLAARHRPR